MTFWNESFRIWNLCIRIYHRNSHFVSWNGKKVPKTLFFILTAYIVPDFSIYLVHSANGLSHAYTSTHQLQLIPKKAELISHGRTFNAISYICKLTCGRSQIPHTTYHMAQKKHDSLVNNSKKLTYYARREVVQRKSINSIHTLRIERFDSNLAATMRHYYLFLNAIRYDYVTALLCS